MSTSLPSTRTAYQGRAVSFSPGVDQLATTGLRTCCAIAIKSHEDGVYHSLVHADDTTSKEDVLELARAIGLGDKASFVACTPDPHWKSTFAKWQLPSLENRSDEVAPTTNRVVMFVIVTREKLEYVLDNYEPPDHSLGGQLTQTSNLWNILLHEQRPMRFGALVLQTEDDFLQVLKSLQEEVESLAGLGIKMKEDVAMKATTWSKFNDYLQRKYAETNTDTLNSTAKGCCHPMDYDKVNKIRGKVARLKAIKLLLIQTQTLNAVRCFALIEQPQMEEEITQKCKKWLGFK